MLLVYNLTKLFCQFNKFCYALCMLFMPVLLNAQALLPSNVNNTPGVTDYILPNNITEISITVSGAQGGGVGPSDCLFRGGFGATVKARFLVGLCSNQNLTPGGTLRLISGSAGQGQQSRATQAGGGGGGSALLYKAPQSSDWIILAAAGGGGGAYGSNSICSGANGGDAQLNTSGASTAVAGGINGNGGSGGGLISYGGGGAFSNGVTLGNQGCNGKAGFPNGGAGGNCNEMGTTTGGSGFGSGAAGVGGGGGGGGYSGGAGGNSGGGGGGGGSFIYSWAVSGSTSIVADKSGSGTINIISTIGTVAQPVSLASATLDPISASGCNAISFTGSGAAYAYSTSPVAISLAQFNAAGGVISNNSCSIQSIAYVDAVATSGSKTIDRTFTVTDVNNRTATCTQVINLVSPALEAGFNITEQTLCANAQPESIQINLSAASRITVRWYRSELPNLSLNDPDQVPQEITEAYNQLSYTPLSQSFAGTIYYFARIIDECGSSSTIRSEVSFTQAQEWVLDKDQDGYYTGNVVMACSSPGQGYVVKSMQLPGDCNDNPLQGGAAIKPGATEVRDGIDNDCDGSIDEGLPPIDLPASPTNLTTTTPGVTDYTIPSGFTSISFTVQGAKGGSLVKSPIAGPGGIVVENPAGNGGVGARMKARFTVDANCEQALKPGGIIRLIVGSTPAKVAVSGPSFLGSDPINYGQGGGGGSSILYQAPGSTGWVPLVVAGGGGGAAAVVEYGGIVTPSNGQPGIVQKSSANTGTNESGGRSTFTIQKGDFIKGDEGTIVITAGGGGGMLGDGKAIIFEGVTITEIGDCGGGRGLDASADGGVASACPNGNPGGAGFGAGGSGVTGGGGGGGYSGGNGGAVATGGFGAGSFTSSLAEELPLENPSPDDNGSITIATASTATLYYPDGDGDNFGTGDGEIFCTNPGEGYATEGGDCDDEDDNITTPQTWVLDNDEDGYYIGNPVNSCTSPGNGYKIKEDQVAGDCDDGNSDINPGVPEIDCDGIDNNCDGDEGGSCNECIAETYYRDQDGDGYGNPGDFIEICDINPNGYVANNLDCNDDDIAINPNTIWYKDADNDGYSDGTTITQCEQPDDYKLAADLTATSGDCNDEDAEITIGTTWYLDADEDGYAASTIISCTSPGENYTTNVLPLGDCEDGNSEIYPATVWYEDRDNDGYPSDRSITGCERPQFFYGGFIPTGFTLGKLASELDGLTLDCDDTDASVSPGTIWYKDADNDFFSDGSTQTGCYRPSGYKRPSELTSTGGDCNDSNLAVNPSATEICDGIDNNCNGLVDEGFIDTDSDGIANCTDPDDDDDGIPDQADCATLDPTKWRTGTFYIDADEDGLGFGGAVILCYGTDIPLGYVANNNDCVDADRFNTPLQLNCPASIEINDCSITAITTVTGLAYNTTGAQITEQQLVDANGSIIQGACAVASIAYKDMEDPTSTSLKKIIKRSFTVTDIRGRIFDCIQTITVEDKTVPLVLVNDITVQLGADGKVTITPAQINNNSSDVCGIAAYSLSQTEFDCSNLGQNKVLLTVKDVNNNEASAEATVTVEDKTAPSFTAPADRNVTLGDNCSYRVPDLITGLTGSDNCGTVTFTQSPAATLTTGVHNGQYDVTITANDGNGNSIQKTVKLTAKDETDPVLAMPVSLSISCTESVLPANTGEATATDNCDPQPLVTYMDISTQGTNPSSCDYYNYKITRTWKALDAAGNSSSLEQIIDVADITKPEITCVVQPEGGFKRSTDAGLCTYKVQGSEFDATATDNCATPVITWSVTGATSISGNNSMANAELNFGVNKITWTANDPCGNVANCEIIVDVNKVITTTSVTVTPAEIQYSDKVRFTATVTPYNCMGAENIGGKVTFKIGSLVMGEANVVNGVATLNDVPVLEDMLYDANLNDPSNATAGPLKPGSKTVTAIFSGTDDDYQVNNPTTSLNVTCEDAEVSNTGQQYFTVNPNSNTGTVVLSAFVADFNDEPAGARGDIRNATVTFKDGGSSGSVIGTPDIPVGLIDPGVTTEGIASTDINYTLTNSDISDGGKIFEVWTGAYNYYCGETGGELTNVTIALPGQEFVTGGGHIIMQNSKGKYAGKAGKKMNFGLVMKWNKSGKNLQGKVNIIYRAEVNGVVKIYQIKSNAISSLAVLDVNDNGVTAKGNAITFRKAIIVTKATLTDVTNPLVPVSLGGGYSFEVTAWESTTNTTGALDRVSVQLMGSGSEGLLFSSNWSGRSTVWQTLNGGKMQVRSNTTTLPAPITNKRIDILTESSLFELKGYPNPTSSSFNIHVQSSDDKGRILLRVIDISGKTVQKIENIKAGQILNIGATYKPGIYMVEMVQGNNRKQLKLIKQPD